MSQSDYGKYDWQTKISGGDIIKPIPEGFVVIKKDELAQLMKKLAEAEVDSLANWEVIPQSEYREDDGFAFWGEPYGLSGWRCGPLPRRTGDIMENAASSFTFITLRRKEDKKL